MNKAVFMDRDGVLTVENKRITSPEDVEIFDYSRDCVAELHNMGYMAVVITNQSGIARGLFKEEELQVFHEELRKRTGVDAIYYCPHHAEGIIQQYSIQCECRKPDPGLICKAAKEMGINLMESYMVGDRGTDIIAGQSAGLRTVLLESGYGSMYLEDGIFPDVILRDLREFVLMLRHSMILGSKE